MTSFSDDFNRANSTDLGANWVEVSGDWSISSNQLSPGSAGGVIILRAATAMASNDHFVQVTIAATTAASHGVWARGNSNITQGYLWRNDGTSWNLFSVVGGSFTSLASYTAAAVAGDVAKLQVVGSAITAYVNGTQRASVTDTAVTTGTSVGIRSESASAIRFDDFSAADVTAGATLGIASVTETAQSLTGSKVTALGLASGVETAQALAGSKASLPSPAVATETAQPLAGIKTAVLGTALELATTQPLAGAKAAPLSVATQTETAQPLTGTLVRSLGTAASIEAAQQLTGAKTATLGVALETSTARPLTQAGPDVDIDVTVGQPYSRWAVSEPSSDPWPVGAPY